MSFDFENAVVISDAEARALDVKDLRVIATPGERKGSNWVATAYVEGDTVRTVVAIDFGKNPKKLVKSVLAKALKVMGKKDATE